MLDFPRGSDGKESACNAGNLGSIPGWGRSLEEGNATHSSILTWRISWTQESGWLQSMWSQSWTRLRDRGRCWVFLAAQGISSRWAELRKLFSLLRCLGSSLWWRVLSQGRALGPQAQHLRLARDLLSAGMEPASPVLAAGFLSAKPPGKPGSSSCSSRLITYFMYWVPCFCLLNLMWCTGLLQSCFTYSPSCLKTDLCSCSNPALCIFCVKLCCIYIHQTIHFGESDFDFSHVNNPRVHILLVHAWPCTHLPLGYTTVGQRCVSAL